MRWLYYYLSRSLGSDEKEARAVLFSFAYFFSILFAYFILQPLRDEIGLLLGKEEIPSLFRWSLVAMIVANPLFSALVTRMPRTTFISVTYRFFALNILLFVMVFKYMEIIGVLAPNPDGSPIVLQGWYRLAPSLYYVWVGVFNLFGVSVFWALMADLFRGDQAKRVFGFIGAGGTLGQWVGSAATSQLVYWLGPTYLLLVSFLFLEVGVRCMYGLTADMEGGLVVTEPTQGGKPKSVWAGVQAIFASPYLLMICLYLFLYTFTSSFLYFQKQEIVANTIVEREDRVNFFAKINLAVSTCTFLTQILLTGRLLPWLGVTICLSLVPVVTAIGFVILGKIPQLLILAVFEVLRKTANYAISRPSREVLFTAVSKEEKYLSKSFIDTFVYRAGDAVASVAFEGFKAFFALGFVGLSLSAVPFAVIWTGVGISLGKAHARLSGDEITEPKRG